MDEMEHDIATPGVLQRENEDPFVTPMASTVSLNTPQDSAIMTESTDGAAKEPSNKQRNHKRRSKRKSYIPPPQPLDIPQPLTPPPRTGSPHANRPPEPIPAPAISEAAQEQEEEVSDKRWWTDWLCGCREHGDNQVSDSMAISLSVLISACTLAGRSNESIRVMYVSLFLTSFTSRCRRRCQSCCIVIGSDLYYIVLGVFLFIVPTGLFSCAVRIL